MIPKCLPAIEADVVPASGNLLQWRSMLLVVAVTLVSATKIHARAVQSTTEPLPSFEVVSIRPNHSEESGRRLDMRDPGRVALSNVTAKDLITLAYSLYEYQISGGPSWINSEKYNINAKEEDFVAEELQKLPRDQRVQKIDLMIGSLLTDRFNLRFHHDNKQLPVYVLVVAKNGPKIHNATPGDTYPNGLHLPNGSGAGILRVEENKLTGQGVPISSLAARLQSALGRPVLEQTGLKGTYDFILQWTSQSLESVFKGPEGANAGAGDANLADASELSLSIALQEQLGLKLESTKGQVDLIMIDHIEKPSEN